MLNLLQLLSEGAKTFAQRRHVRRNFFLGNSIVSNIISTKKNDIEKVY